MLIIHNQATTTTTQTTVKPSKTAQQKLPDQGGDSPTEKVYGIEIKRRASHYSENSDKVAEAFSEHLDEKVPF